MSHSVRILCGPGVAAGFSLTSLPVVTASTAADAAEVCRGWLEDPAIGVVLIQQDFHDALPDDVTSRLTRRSLPMVVPFPRPAWEVTTAGSDAYIVDLLRQVIGYRVRLR